MDSAADRYRPPVVVEHAQQRRACGSRTTRQQASPAVRRASLPASVASTCKGLLWCRRGRSRRSSRPRTAADTSAVKLVPKSNGCFVVRFERAADALPVHVGRGRLEHLDAGEQFAADDVEWHQASAALRLAVTERQAVDGDVVESRADASNLDEAALTLLEQHRDAGDAIERLADILVGQSADLIGVEHVDDTVGRAFAGHRARVVYGWLKPGEMVTGLGLAETTPGPLILVLVFVAFVGGSRVTGLDPLTGGLLGGLTALWFTFVPCFLWIFAGAPFIEAAGRVKWLSAALSAITAAVVGVIANLALWFGLHVLFGDFSERAFGPFHLPQIIGAQFDIWSALIAIAAGVALIRYHVNLLWVIGASALAGIALRLSGLA